VTTSKKEAENKGQFPKVQERVAAVCGIGKGTVQRALQESRLAVKKCGYTSFVKEKYSEAYENRTCTCFNNIRPPPLKIQLTAKLEFQEFHCCGYYN
jgi:hypothetical protein